MKILLLSSAFSGLTQRFYTEMDSKINDDNWTQDEVQDFVENWGKHIIHSDMSFNRYMKQTGFVHSEQGATKPAQNLTSSAA